MSARHRLLLLPVPAVLFALSACAPTTTNAPPAAAPKAPASTSADAPASPEGNAPASPEGDAPATSSTKSKAPADDAGKGIECPSPKTLEGLVDLPKDWTLGSVDCVEDWAAADPDTPTPADGVYLFHYKSGKGWQYYGEGSGYDCKDLGLDEAPFCIS